MVDIARPTQASKGAMISALGVVMIFTWGSTYYLMAVLAAPIAADTGWPLSGITAALSVGMLVAGLASPTVGRAISHHGGRPVLAIGCVLIALGLSVIALAPHLWLFWVGWLLLGVGMAAGLYDPAFASLGRLYGADARRAITMLTLWGGFASTVCWPLSTVMLETWGWRGVAGAYAAIHICLTLPLVLIVLPAEQKRVPETVTGATNKASLQGQEKTVFILMAVLLVLNGLIAVNIATWLFTFLQAQGYALAVAVGLGTLIGPSQVAARVLEMLGGGRHHPIWTMIASAAGIGTGVVLLASGLDGAGMALILFGGGNGLFSIARGALPLAVFGVDRYPAIIGQLARPSLIAAAAAPMLGAWLISVASPDLTLRIIAVLAVANGAVVFLLWRVIRRG